jgi:hypothetical protein
MNIILHIHASDITCFDLTLLKHELRQQGFLLVTQKLNKPQTMSFRTEQQQQRTEQQQRTYKENDIVHGRCKVKYCIYNLPIPASFLHFDGGL